MGFVCLPYGIGAKRVIPIGLFVICYLLFGPPAGGCDWIEIVSLDTTKTAKEWQKKYQIEMADDRIQFGFFHDTDYDKSGIKVKNCIEGECVAKEMGLLPEDVIIKMDGIEIKDIDDMDSLKTFKSRGDEVNLTVMRDGKKLELKGQFPDTTYYDAFKYSKPSGAVKATYFGNHFSIETSQVGKIAIYLHPNMVNLENPVSVKINGREVFNDNVDIDRDFMVENFIKNRDRTALWVKRLIFKI